MERRWLSLGVLLYLARCDAAVLKCSPGSEDPLCASEERDISPPPTPPEVECQAGSEWESNCHYCRCSDSGVAECLKQESCDLQVFEEPIKCKPQTRFLRDCNTCVCLDNGLGLCTIKGCLTDIDTDRRKREAPARGGEKKCVPGTSWKESCNTCWCTDAGVVCTRVGCVSNITKREAPVQNVTKECEPGTSFKKECNTCWCTDIGIPVCTKKGCLNSAINKRSIQKRETSKVEPKITKTSNITKRVVCVANRMFIMDCNTCWCNEDGTSFFCTRRICTPDSTDDNATEDPDAETNLRVVKKECRPNEVFELDCNMCRCNADGTSFSCTRRACVDTDDKNTTLIRKIRATQENAKTCQPGTEFRMDCNKCLCNEEGQDFSCTRIDCAAQNGNGGVDSFTGARSKRELSERKSMQCVAGSVFDQECNVCRCTTDGQHAVCTLKRCKQETTEAETEPSPSFRCTPGDQFRRDCRDCTCSADGKTVFCTLRLCDEDLVDGQTVV